MSRKKVSSSQYETGIAHSFGRPTRCATKFRAESSNRLNVRLHFLSPPPSLRETNILFDIHVQNVNLPSVDNVKGCGNIHGWKVQRNVTNNYILISLRTHLLISHLSALSIDKKNPHIESLSAEKDSPLEVIHIPLVVLFTELHNFTFTQNN